MTYKVKFPDGHQLVINSVSDIAIVTNTDRNLSQSLSQSNKPLIIIFE